MHTHPRRHPVRDSGDHSGWVGVDRGLSAYLVAATSGGVEVDRVTDQPKPLVTGIRRRRRLARSVTRKQAGSRNRRKAAARLARHHHHIRNTRAHFLHQVSNRLVKTHDRLVIENLDVRDAPQPPPGARYRRRRMGRVRPPTPLQTSCRRRVIGVRLHDMDTEPADLRRAVRRLHRRRRGHSLQTSCWRRVPDAAIPARAKVHRLYVNSALAKTEAPRERLRRGDHADDRRPRQRGLGREHRHDPRRRAGHALGNRRRPRRHHARHGHRSRSAGAWPQVVERSIDRTELYACDELFLCGTGAQVAPVIEVDESVIGSG